MKYLLCTLLLAMRGFSAWAEEDYFPFAVGQESVTAGRTVEADGTITEGVFHYRIDGVEALDGKTYFRTLTWWEGPPGTAPAAQKALVRKDEKAVYSYSDAAKAEILDIVLPLKVGATWQRAKAGDTLTDTVIGLESVTIAGKTYEKCFHLHTASALYAEDSWHAAGIGTVKVEIVFPDGRKSTGTLTEHKPGK